MFSRFDTIPVPACDRQTDRRTDGQTELVYLRRASALLLTHVNYCQINLFGDKKTVLGAVAPVPPSCYVPDN